jgi:hypothetical protein
MTNDEWLKRCCDFRNGPCFRSRRIFLGAEMKEAETGVFFEESTQIVAV